MASRQIPIPVCGVGRLRDSLPNHGCTADEQPKMGSGIVMDSHCIPPGEDHQSDGLLGFPLVEFEIFGLRLTLLVKDRPPRLVWRSVGALCCARA
jgi:hypothetical protein